MKDNLSCSHFKQEQVIVDELRKITRHIDDTVATETAIDDWQFAASVIDRLCCIIFALFLIILTVVLFAAAPSIEM